MDFMTDKAPALPFKIIASGCLIILLSFGPRSAMGLYQIPLLADTGWDRSTFGLALAIQNLCWGLGQPFFGSIADKYGAGRVLVSSAVFYISGLSLMAYASAPIWLHIGAGLLIGLGVAAASFSVILAIFARNVAPEKRSIAFGLATAFSSLSMFLFSPFSQYLISQFGWQDALLWTSGLILLVPLLATQLRGNSASSTNAKNQYEQSVAQALKEAYAHKSYVLLTAGFFVCGFQVAFITVHFPAYIADIGIDATYAVLALTLIGFFNIIGSLGSGVLGQKYSKPHLLSYIYFGRAVLITLFLIIPQTPLTIIIFASIMGILWLSTVAPTNALIPVMFGTRHMGLLGGLVFLSHQVGSFIGVYAGGVLFDIYKSYDPIWWASVALGIFAGFVHLPIKEEPVLRPA